MGLRVSDASTAVPILQMTPVLSFVLAYIVLGETLSSNQMIGGALIVCGAVVISIEMGEGARFRCRGDVLWLMTGASLFHAVQFLLFKVFAIRINFWSTMFWESVGFICFGIFLLTFVESYRRDFFSVFGKSRRATGINLAAEAINITGKVVFNYVSLLIPITLAWIGVGLQPLFILAYSVLLTIFLPHIGTENVLGKHLVQKLLAVGTMLVGVYILNV